MQRAGDANNPDPPHRWLLSSLLDEFASIQRISVRRDGTIKGANATLAGQLGVALSRLPGRRIDEIMTDADGAIALQWAEGGDLPAGPRLLNFVNMKHQPFTLRCVAARMGDDLQIVGEAADAGPMLPADQLIQVNNEFATLTRELERRGRELERTQARLDRALQELAAVSPQLRPSPPGAPRCPECGRGHSAGEDDR